MKELSNKATGDELKAEEWDNHSKELENVVTKANYSLGDEEDALIKSIDNIAKSTYYTTTADTENEYVIDTREIDVEEINKGNIITVKFAEDNTDSCTLDLNGAKNIKNKDGSDLNGRYIKKDDIIPLTYDGSDFYTTIQIPQRLSSDNTFSYTEDDDSVIQGYVEWEDSMGANPHFNFLVVRGYHTPDTNEFNCTVILIADKVDDVDPETLDSTGFKLDLKQIFKDQFNRDFSLTQFVSNASYIVPHDEENNLLFPTGVIPYDLWKDGYGNDGKIVTNLGRSQWINLDISDKIDYWDTRFAFIFQSSI